MPTIRTTMQPDFELDVSDTEYTDLKRQGLLVEDDSETPAPPAVNPTSTPAAAPAKNPAAAKSKE